MNFSSMVLAAQLSQVVKDGDKIIIQKHPLPTVNEIVSEIGKSSFDTMTVTFNDEAVTIQKPRLSTTLNGHKSDGMEIVKSGDNWI